MSEAMGSLAVLPTEVLGSIFERLPNSDIKNVRLTCKDLSVIAIAQLRLDRVFLSASQQNIDACNGIANHEVLRHKVNEIIYDESILGVVAQQHFVPNRIAPLQRPAFCHLMYKGFDTGGIRNVRHADDRYDATIPKHQPITEADVKASWNLYTKMMVQEGEVIQTNADEKAFALALARFPRLRRVTLTVGLHGDPLTSNYPSPMIRGLPSTFVHPLPRRSPLPIKLLPGFNHGGEWSDPKVKEQWRTFCFISRLLAQSELAEFEEFIFDYGMLPTGLHCRLFDESDCDEYKSFAAILGKPCMTRLDLALSVRCVDGSRWPASRSNNFRSALAEAVNMQHFSLTTNVKYGEGAPVRSESLDLTGLFPIKTWTQLRHFSLCRFVVKQQELFSLIASLPPTLRFIELSFLDFATDNGSYRLLLKDMRDKLDWGERSISERPRVKISIDHTPRQTDTFINIDSEVRLFLFYGGPNPFHRRTDNYDFSNELCTGIGIQSYVCNPALNKPVPSHGDPFHRIVGYLRNQHAGLEPPMLHTHNSHEQDLHDFSVWHQHSQQEAFDQILSFWHNDD